MVRNENGKETMITSETSATEQPKQDRLIDEKKEQEILKNESNEENLFQHLPSFYEDDELLKRPKNYYCEFEMNQIIPRLFLSDDMAARNRALLDKNKITHILNLTVNIPNKYEPEITYMKLIIFDFESQDISQYFAESFEFIDNALTQCEHNSVLVHCNAGISRSSSFIIAYLLQKRIFIKYKDAYKHVKKCRPVISPNRGFEKQLLNLEQRIRKKKTTKCSIM